MFFPFFLSTLHGFSPNIQRQSRPCILSQSAATTFTTDSVGGGKAKRKPTPTSSE